jgi:hypothetical protein
MRAEAQSARDGERDWWLRVLLVLQAPRAAFAPLRTEPDRRDQSAQEPITAVVLLAGVAAVLGSPTSGTLLDQPDLDGLVVAVLAFLAGGLYGVFGYFVLGGALALGVRGAGAETSYRRARYTLALAAAPVAFSLLALWPIRLAAFGGDEFRRGGSDGGALGAAFEIAEWVVLAWALALLAVGLRTTYRLSWARVPAALALAALSLAGLALLLYVFG